MCGSCGVEVPDGPATSPIFGVCRGPAGAAHCPDDIVTWGRLDGCCRDGVLAETWWSSVSSAGCWWCGVACGFGAAWGRTEKFSFGVHASGEGISPGSVRPRPPPALPPWWPEWCADCTGGALAPGAGGPVVAWLGGKGSAACCGSGATLSEGHSCCATWARTGSSLLLLRFRRGRRGRRWGGGGAWGASSASWLWDECCAGG